MKKWTFKKKLLLLCFSLMIGIIAISGVSFRSIDKLITGMNDINQVEIPALFHMNMTDMAHDGLRAVVYKALYVSTTDDTEAKSEVAEELKEFTENLNTHFGMVDRLHLPSNVEETTLKAKPEVAAYIQSADEIVGLALVGQREKALLQLGSFDKAFTSLADRFEVLGELIRKDALSMSQAEEDAARSMQIFIICISLFSVLLGAVVAVFIIRDLLSTLSSAIDRLSKSSHEVSQASEQSASSATELSEAATEQAASLQETMASVEEISAMVSQNAESAVKVKDAVDMNQKMSEEGSRSVGNMLQAIGEIKETNEQILSQMESSNKEFGEIVQIISEIDEKTKVINDIVFQTKLLSFNASVEAARAGEHGKGFAVVAEEVGNLAQMSGNAAKQITDMLSESIKRVNEIVDSTKQRVDHLVEVGKDKISMGQSTAEKCRDALDKIAGNAKTVTSMVAEITHASKEQAQGIQEINKAIGQLDQVTQQNSAVAQHSSTQAEQLRSEAGSLSHALNHLIFFLNGADAAGMEGEVPDSAPMIKSETTKAQVIQLNTKSKSNVTSRVADGVKHRAANSDVVPSSDDPKFEEF